MIINNIIMINSEFENIMIEILDDVFTKRAKKNVDYYNLIQKLWLSNKTNKLELSKLLLSRLMRETNRIFIQANNFAKRHYDYCSNKTDKYERKVYH